MTLYGLGTPMQANRLKGISNSSGFQHGTGEHREVDHSLTLNRGAVFRSSIKSGDLHNSKPRQRLIEGMNAALIRPAIDQTLDVTS